MKVRPLMAALCALFVSQTAFSIGSDAFLAELRELVQSIDTYQVRIAQWSVADDTLDAKIMNYYYSAPDLVRVDVLEGTRGAGTTGILAEDGKVTVRTGSRLVPVRLSFALDHRLVTTNRGRTFLDGSLLGILDQLDAFASTCGIEVEHRDGLLIVTAPACDQEETQVIEFDADSLLPRRSATYEGETLVEAVNWSLFVFAESLPDELFSASMSQREVERAGVKLSRIPVGESERISARLR